MSGELNPAVVITHDGEVRDRGMFNFNGKEEEKTQENDLVAGVDKIHIDEEEKQVEQEEEKKNSLLDKVLHRSRSSSSSSSSDEEEGENEKKEKRKKKREVNDEIKEKVHCDYTEVGEVEKFEETQEVVAVADEDDTAVEVEDMETTTVDAVVGQKEKKGYLEKMQEKLHKKPVEEAVETTTVEEAVVPERKGPLEKIQEKLHKKPVEEGVEASPPVVPPPAVAAVESEEHHVKEQEAEKKSFLTKIKEKLPGYHKSSGDEVEKNAASE